MIKIVHCADVHLDSPFTLNDIRNAELRRMELRSTFSSLVMFAKNYGARIFLVAGDLFDDAYISKNTANLIVKEMASYPDCYFFIAPGEKDPYHARSPYKMMKWPENVHIFKSNDLTKIEIPELNIDVYGYAFTSNSLQVNPFANKKPQNTNRINILVGHGDITANSQCCPITPGDISKSGFDYIALGHIHKGTGVIQVGETSFSYPGCLEGRNFGEDELGPKGAMYGEIDKGSCEELKGVKLAKRRYETVKVDVSQYITENQLIEAIRLATGAFHEETALRVELTGMLRPEFVFNPASIEQKFTGFYFMQIKNSTSPYIDANTLRYDKTVRGIFFRRLESRLNSGSEQEREEAKLALQYGLNAFAGLNIIDF